MSFDSIKAYQLAKGATVDNTSPTNEIKNLLYPSTVPSGYPNTITVVSTIAGYGTVIDSVNVIVRDGLEEMGDVLLDKSGTKYWLKSMLALNGAEMLALGGVYYNSAIFPSGYTPIGILVDKDHDDMLLMSINETTAMYQLPDVVANPSGNPKTNGYFEYNNGSYTASNDSSVVPGKTYYVFAIVPNVVSYNLTTLGNRATDFDVSGCRAKSESFHKTNYNQYIWPFPRRVFDGSGNLTNGWDAMMVKIKANLSGSNKSMTAVSNPNGNPQSKGYFEASGSSYVLTTDTTVQSGKTYYMGYIWSVTVSSDGTGLGVGSFSFTHTSGSKTCNPKDYGYSFDKWYKSNIEVMWPASTNAASDMDGLQNTKALIAWAGVNAETKVPAAYWCSQKSVNVDGFGQGNWFLPACGQMIKALRLTTILTKKNVHPAAAAHYSSTQSGSAPTSWRVSYATADVARANKTVNSRVRAFIHYHR